MKKLKSSQSRDRFSELPDSLIFEIFWFLPMPDVVRTTILSKRWKNLWTTTPYLNFSFENEVYLDEDRFPSFVNLALLSWRGIKIQKLNIDPPLLSDLSPVYQYCDVWLRLAVDKKVEEMYVNWCQTADAYLMPHRLYSCSSLKSLSIEGCDIKIKETLSIEGCDIKINEKVKWDQLKSLRIEGVCLVGCEQLFQKILCGSPQLEVLILSILDNKENLTIRSNTLKKLSIHNHVHGYDYKPSKDNFHTVLKIWSPNLETLDISGVPYSACLLLDVSSLTDVTLAFNGVGLYELFDDTHIFRKILWYIVSAIHHVERLTLSDWCIKVFADIASRDDINTSFMNVKFLKLYAFGVEYEHMVDILGTFPNLNMLVLQNEKMKERLDLRYSLTRRLKFAANIPNSFLLQLITFEIAWSEDDDSIFPLIEFVLKCAIKLEKMVIRVIRVEGIMPSSDSLFLASKKLLGMPRSSPNCRVSFI